MTFLRVLCIYKLAARVGPPLSPAPAQAAEVHKGIPCSHFIYCCVLGAWASVWLGALSKCWDKSISRPIIHWKVGLHGLRNGVNQNS